MNQLSTNDILKQYITDGTRVDKEHLQKKLKISYGDFPKSLQGILLRNGVGKFENHGVRYQHLFDGDGMISAFHIENGTVYYSNRYVQTEEFIREKEAGKMLYRSLGTNIPGGFHKNFGKLKIKNTANTNVIYHGGKLLALWEGGLPYEIDPMSLNTLGKYNYEGKLLRQKSWMEPWINPELSFSAHPKIHASSGEMYNFGMIAGMRNYLVTHLISPNGKLVHQEFYLMDEYHFVHDFVLTDDKSMIFFLNSISFDLWRTFWGTETALGSIKGKGEPTKILCIDVDGKAKELMTDHCFIFHFANAYDTGPGKYVVDALKMDEFPDATGAVRMMNSYEFENKPAFLTRYTLDFGNQKIVQERLSEHAIELPAINPDFSGKPHRFVWGIGANPENPEDLLHNIIKVDTHQKRTLNRNFYPNTPGEPVMVPKPGGEEDEGWLFVLIYNYSLRISQLVLLDSQSLEVVSIADLPHCLPMSFHGTWVESF